MVTLSSPHIGGGRRKKDFRIWDWGYQALGFRGVQGLGFRGLGVQGFRV